MDDNRVPDPERLTDPVELGDVFEVRELLGHADSKVDGDVRADFEALDVGVEVHEFCAEPVGGEEKVELELTRADAESLSVKDAVPDGDGLGVSRALAAAERDETVDLMAALVAVAASAVAVATTVATAVNVVVALVDCEAPSLPEAPLLAVLVVDAAGDTDDEREATVLTLPLGVGDEDAVKLGGAVDDAVAEGLWERAVLLDALTEAVPVESTLRVRVATLLADVLAVAEGDPLVE